MTKGPKTNRVLSKQLQLHLEVEEVGVEIGQV